MEYVSPESSKIKVALSSGYNFLMQCEVCQAMVHCKQSDCEHGKNGYCALFRLQAAKDMKTFKIK